MLHAMNGLLISRTRSSLLQSKSNWDESAKDNWRVRMIFRREIDSFLRLFQAVIAGASVF